jgi:hypothetical protein
MENELEVARSQDTPEPLFPCEYYDRERKRKEKKRERPLGVSLHENA